LQDSAADVPFKGDIEITVGHADQNYNSFIHLNMEKKTKI
jgi:hypothetical protein